MSERGVITDDLNAFANLSVHVPGAAGGPLSGMGVCREGHLRRSGIRYGRGNPDWERTHGPAEHTAPAVQALLDAGATLVGRRTPMSLLAASWDGIHITAHP